MRVLAAPDKFRGTAGARDVATAIAAAARRHGAQCRILPMADGGEGTLEAFGGPNRVDVISGPLGAPVSAGWRFDAPSRRAIVESAAACGLDLVAGAQGNDAETATTYGVGELLAAAVRTGARHITLGVGGSATTDGGCGALDALAAAGLRDAFRDVELVVCCDVGTPFTAAATVFGPQKGADPAAVTRLSARLADLRDDYLATYGVDVDAITGSGAAGGLAGALAVIGARLVRGVDVVAAALGLDAAIAATDVVVTGEGRLDATSLTGKVVGEVSARARAAGRPLLVIAGVVDPDVVVPGALVRSLVTQVGRSRAWHDTIAAVEQVAYDALATTSPRSR